MVIYQTSKGWKITSYVVFSLLIIFCMIGLAAVFMDDSISQLGFYLGIPFFLLLASGFSILFLDAIKGQVIITEDTIFLKKTLRTRSLKFAAIKGFKIDDNYIYLLPKDTTQKQLKIGRTIGNLDTFLDWTQSKFTDLEYEKATATYNAIVEDTEYGETQEARQKKLDEAHGVTLILNCIGVGLCLWTLFYPHPYKCAIIACILCSFLAFLAAFFYKGLIQLDENKGSVLPSINTAILVPSIALILRALLDFNILTYSNLWLPLSFFAIGMALITILFLKEFQNNLAKYFAVFLVLYAIYGYGFIIMVNCLFDSTHYTIYKAEVLNKRLDKGDSNDYYLELAPWGRQTEIGELKVEKLLYDNIKVHQDVSVYLKKGRFNIPWYWVEQVDQH